jgi:hypothetical protein
VGAQVRRRTPIIPGSEPERILRSREEVNWKLRQFKDVALNAGSENQEGAKESVRKLSYSMQ